MMVHAETESREEHITVDLTRPLMLEVHNPAGDVTVRASDRADVLISHHLHGYFGAPGDDEPALLIEVHDNRIEVRPNPRIEAGWAGLTADIDLDAIVGQITNAFKRGGPWSAMKPGRVRVAGGHHHCPDITIELPRSIGGRVEVRTASGDVRIEDVAAEIALTTMSGDVRVAGTDGKLTVQSASGDLNVEGARGHLEARTASGDVRIGAARLGGAQFQTASGNIHLEATLEGNGAFRAQSASGDVRLELRQPAASGEDPAATLTFQTISGDASVSPPFRKTERRRWQSGSGDASGPRIEVTTVSGDLSASIVAEPPAERTFVPTSPAPLANETSVVADEALPATPGSPAREPSPVQAVEPGAPIAPSARWAVDEPLPPTFNPAAAQAPAPGEAARLAVLEAVERGEIDIDEALRRLEATDVAANPPA